MGHSRVVVGLACVIVWLSATAAPADAVITQPSFTNNVVERIKTSGSAATFGLLQDLGHAFMQSEGCYLTPVEMPLTVGSPSQNQCRPLANQTPDPVTTENYDHETVENYFPEPGRSDDGIKQLCAQSDTPARDSRVPLVDIARSVNAVGSGFQCTVANGAPTSGVVLRFIAFARQAISWRYWPGSPGAVNLTIQQLKDIFVNCTLTNWNQTFSSAPYPAPTGEPIRVFTLAQGPYSAGDAGPELRDWWDQLLGGNTENCIPAQFKDGNPSNGERVVRERLSDAQGVRAVEDAANDSAAADEAYSIFLGSVGWLDTHPALAGNSQVGAINSMFPEDSSIRSGAFPFSRIAYNVIRNGGASPQATGANRRFSNSSGSVSDQTQGWFCKPTAAHSQPVGTSTAGIETVAASLDYGQQVINIVRNAGFYPLVADNDVNARRCAFTDVTVT